MALDSQNRFGIQNYHLKPPFASFLPGIAGPMGIPLWVFYVNRGQAIASFGVQDKNSPVVEFQPANKAYCNVFTYGFRTFIKLASGRVYEPFSDFDPQSNRITEMQIGLNDLIIKEKNPDMGLEVEVLYFTMPMEPFGALIRRVKILNRSATEKRGEALDGLPAVIPFGVNNWFLKEMCNTATAWMGVDNLEMKVPFYKVRSSIEDRPEVEEHQAGHFYGCFASSSGNDRPLDPVVDPALIFGQTTALTYPAEFLSHSLSQLYHQKQICLGKIPCGFFGTEFNLTPGETITLTSLIGHVDRLDIINKRASDIFQSDFVRLKHQEAVALTENLTNAISTESSDPLFDRYCRQTYLDNILRGGKPIGFGSKTNPHIYYLYSRKHGDLERDYNFFTTQPEYYSQGNGNFRDVCQNRRCDVFFDPEIGEHNIETFMNLIQTDGYNPLVIKGSTFSLSPEVQEEILASIPPEFNSKLSKILTKPFTPGQLLKTLENRQIELDIPAEEFLQQVLSRAGQEQHAEYGEGYWVDHWTYCLDLIDNYRVVFPDRDKALFFTPKYTYFDNDAVVRPRRDKYFLRDGRIGQYDAVYHDPDMRTLINKRPQNPHLMRIKCGHGEIYRTTLFVKLLNLAAVKFATLDPECMGIEMEAGKPGWYDALNGLPALFGSSVSETCELLRLLELLIRLCQKFLEQEIQIPQEVWQLATNLAGKADQFSYPENNFEYWNHTSSLREQYREETKYGFSGVMETLSLKELMPVLVRFLRRVNAGIERALHANNGLPPTYFRYEVTRWEQQSNPDGMPRQDDKGRMLVTAKEFRQITMPLFLEGIVKAMKMTRDPEEARTLYNKVKQSGLYDEKLKMYKVNISLQDQPMAIGRARAFTPGWLENESIFTHMHYKYLLALLKAGLIDEFWDEAQTGLIPFLNPETYGRSILEHSSFIASSAHPDHSIHGQGFVARLSGATAEFLDMWRLILLGPVPFKITPDGVIFQPRPCLPGRMFKKDGTFSFLLFGKVEITYHNPEKVALWEAILQTPSIITAHKEEIRNNSILVSSIMNKEIDQIHFYFTNTLEEK